jgi:uncharacterized protein YkwD
MSLRRRLSTLGAVAPLTVAIALGAAGEASGAPRDARAAAAACPSVTVSPAGADRRVVADATFCLINRERARRGLPRLRRNERLTRSAQRHSRDMVRRTFFSHVSPAGTTMATRIRAAGYLSGAGGYSIGENLAWGSGTRATPLETVQGWMRSPGHRANILRGSFREIGVGVASGAPVALRGTAAAATYTTHFGARRPGDAPSS